jgi:hypothetical protein
VERRISDSSLGSVEIPDLFIRSLPLGFQTNMKPADGDPASPFRYKKEGLDVINNSV